MKFFERGSESRTENKFEEHQSEKESRFVKAEKNPEPKAVFSIDLARHSIKGKKDDREPLSEEGILKAIEAGKSSPLRKKNKAKAVEGQSLEIYGSPRERTGQSALSRMLADQLAQADFENVDPQDMVKWLEGNGVENTQSPLLDFQVGQGEYKDALMADFKKNEFMKFMVEKSDQLAIETKQDPNKVTTFSQQAGSVGVFLLVLGNKKTKEMISAGDRKEDFAFGASHMTVLESFLYKAIKIKDGEKAANKFLEKDLHNSGFSENQGFVADYESFGDEPQDMRLVISYQDRKIALDYSDLIQIIQEGINYTAKLESASNSE